MTTLPESLPPSSPCTLPTPAEAPTSSCRFSAPPQAVAILAQGVHAPIFSSTQSKIFVSMSLVGTCLPVALQTLVWEFATRPVHPLAAIMRAHIDRTNRVLNNAPSFFDSPGRDLVRSCLTGRGEARPHVKDQKRPLCRGGAPSGHGLASRRLCSARSPDLCPPRALRIPQSLEVRGLSPRRDW